MHEGLETGRATALEAVLAAASALLDPEKLAGLVVDHIKTLLRVDGAALYWWDAHEEVLTALADNDPRMSIPIPVINPGQGLVGTAFATNCPQTSARDGEHDEGPSWMRELDVVDAAAVPIVVEGRPRGVLLARTYEPRRFSDDDVHAMRVTAEQIAPTLANMGLLARAQRERNVAHALAELMRAATAAPDTHALLRLIVRYATRLLGADDGAVVQDRDATVDGVPVLRRTAEGSETLTVAVETPKRRFGRLVLRFRTDVTITPPQEQIASTLAGFAASALDRAHVDAEVLRHEAFLRSVLKTAPVAFLAVDRDARVTFHEGIDLVRLGLGSLASGEPLPEREGPAGAMRRIALRALEGVEAVEAIATDSVAVEVRFAPVRDEHGTVVGATGVAIDLSERRGLEEKLAFRATHDALTGLPNRELFLDRLGQALLASSRTHDPLTVVVLDVEELADVNATLGPLGADIALRELAERLARRTEIPGATFARFDGDRFGWILPGTDETAALAFVRRAATAADDPFHVDGHVAGLRVTLGVAPFADAAAGATDLARHAIIAMQRARAEHAPFAVYDPGMDRDPDALAVVTELRDAFTRDALLVRYQPIVALDVRRTVAAEALVRWMHPVRGILSPDAFIPVAERVGLIGRVTSWVMHTALGDLAAWQADGRRCGITINLSAWDVSDRTLPERVASLLRLHRVDPGDVQFEITETAVMPDSPLAVDVLGALHEIGVGIALDDFGTGYSSLGHLQRLPITCMKIDRSFVGEVATRMENRVIVGALIQLGRSLGLDVVAEGIEDEEQLALLQTMGCPRAQGHVFAGAMNAADLAARLRAEAYVEDRSTA